MKSHSMLDQELSRSNISHANNEAKSFTTPSPHKAGPVAHSSAKKPKITIGKSVEIEERSRMLHKACSGLSFGKKPQVDENKELGCAKNKKCNIF